MIRSRRWLFTGISLFIPVIFFVLLELLLHLINYGGDLELVRPVSFYGRKYYQLNSQVGRRYFRGDQVAVPEMFPELLAYEKPDSLIRIVCLGGSTTAGFPFEMNARFTQMMEKALNEAFDGKYSFEVVNVGMSAINSFSVLDFMDELRPLEPDLFIIYMGHNEFYGALGIGSTQNLGKNRAAVLLYLKLMHYRTVRLIRDLVQKGVGLLRGADQNGAGGTLMERVVKRKSIPLNSELYKIARRNFQANVSAIIQKAKKDGAEVFVSSLACNLKDQPPFVSDFSDTTSTATKALWQQWYSRGKSALEQNRLTDAISAFEEAARLDSNHAAAFFMLGESYRKLGKIDEARRAYRRAADCDQLRFRATSEWNRILEKAAKKYRVKWVDMEAAFEQHAIEGIPGNELFFEHLHPNLQGYALMARTFLKAIREMSNRIPEEEWPEHPDWSKEHLCDLAGISEMDEKLALWKIKKLTARWPFQPVDRMLPLMPGTWQDSLAVLYLQKRISWSDVHYRAAKRFEALNSLQKAIREYAAVAAVRPDAFFPRLRMGTLYLELQRLQEAIRVLEEAKRIDPYSVAVYYRMGTAFLLSGELQSALLAYQKALQLDNQKNVLKLGERTLLRYSLALALVQSKKPKEARTHLNWIAEHAPSFLPAKKLLDKLNTNPNISIQFERQKQNKP